MNIKMQLNATEIPETAKSKTTQSSFNNDAKKIVE